MLCMYTTYILFVFLPLFLHLRPLLHHPFSFNLYIHGLSPSHVFLERYDVIILTNAFLHLYRFTYNLPGMYFQNATIS